MQIPYEYYNNKLGVKVSFLIYDKSVNPESLKVISYNALHKRIKSDTCSEQQLRRASLNYEALVLFSSLCQEWRDRLTTKFGSPKTEVKRTWFEQHYESDREAFDFYSAFRFEQDKKLPIEFVELYTYNASVIKTVIKLKNNRKAYMKSIGATQINIWESLTNDVNAFREVAHKLPTTSRGLRILVNKFTKDGYAGLISGRFSNNNASKLKENEQTAVIDELLAKHQNFDNYQIANVYNTVANKLQWPTITPQTVANRKETKQLVITAGRKGTSELSNKVLMQNKRQAPTKPMLYWTLDGWDAELLYQKTDVNSKGYSHTTYHNRLTMVTVLDPYCKYPIGYAIGTHETPALIKEALRNAVKHTKELFGGYYRPYQLQSDNYGKGALTPLYTAISKHYTPAKVGNAKSKVIEPWFNRFNKDYLQFFDNWSGHNVSSGSKNQPNSEMLNKIRHQFPDELGCRQQLIAAIESDRQKKRDEYVGMWGNVETEFKSELNQEMFLNILGETTGYTNRLLPEGLTPTINGQKLCFDSFDINFRKLSNIDWLVKYDPTDLSHVLVTNAESKQGKVISEIGSYQFLLQQKYVQSMALAERNEDDAKQLEAVKHYNQNIIAEITEERQNNAHILEELFNRPQLNDTLAKMILVDSRGQHKNRRNDNRLKEKTKELIEVQTVEDTNTNENTWNNQQSDYYKQKINLNDYL